MPVAIELPHLLLFHELVSRLRPLVVIGSPCCDFDTLTGKPQPSTPPKELPNQISRLIGSCLQISVDNVQQYWDITRDHVWWLEPGASAYSAEGDRLLLLHGPLFHVGTCHSVRWNYMTTLSSSRSRSGVPVADHVHERGLPNARTSASPNRLNPGAFVHEAQGMSSSLGDHSFVRWCASRTFTLTART